MKGIMGGGMQEDIGLLDNQPGHNNNNAGGNNHGGGDQENGGRPSDIGDAKAKAQGGNQDLWLLNLFFKGCALLV